MASNLPTHTTDNIDVKQFFDKFFVNQVSFPSNQIDAVVGFFIKRGFEIESARSTAIVLLNQARIDQVNVLELVDTMKTLTDIQLNQIVAQVLNASRAKTSLLGYRIAPIIDLYESRNILV
jgi:hypothetical protein